jgi:hypothetical protein
MADITIVNVVYKPTYNWGAPSCVNYNGISHLATVAGFCNHPQYFYIFLPKKAGGSWT